MKSQGGDTHAYGVNFRSIGKDAVISHKTSHKL